MKSAYENLAWLLNPPEDFSIRLNEIDDEDDLRELANFSHDENNLRRLYKKTLEFQKGKDKFVKMSPIKMGIISTSTTKMIVPALVGTALRFGVSLEVIEAEYNQIAKEAFSADSTFNDYNLKTLLLAIDYRGLPLSPCPGDETLATKNVDECLNYIGSIVDSLRERTRAQIIIQNIPLPVEDYFGSFEGRLPGTMKWLISKINNELDKFVTSDTFILDIAGLASNVGLINWHDQVLWNLAKIPFSQRYIPIYAEYVCRLLAANIGKSRRCLILDLDNTLWGGVIGDDGIDGIQIGNGNPTAEAHLNIQQTALELRKRGVVLAVCSKNEKEIAIQPFKNHPEMILKEDHIAVFQANWSDKASNIKIIAESLSLGLDSIVILDDNPAERMQIRRELPQVGVPELPKDPSLYSQFLICAGYFEAVTFSVEDGQRAKYYQENAKRANILNSSSDMRSYLISLDMKISFYPFDQVGRGRIAQLISKSNQFNLTTKRYSETDLIKFEQNKDYFTLQIRLKDTFGDNGMISVVICKKYFSSWEIDTWLMSCRVLGRGVEVEVLQYILKNAIAYNIKKLIGYYIPTQRNIIVKDHYKNLGFRKANELTGTEVWELDVENYIYRETYISHQSY